MKSSTTKNLSKKCWLSSFVFYFVTFVSLLSQTPLFGQELRITDIRFWQSPEEAQIVIDLSAAPNISPVGILSDGTFYFDIESCLFRPGKQSYSLNNQFLSVLTVQEREKGVRVFFRVPAGVRQRTFLLPKNNYKPNRVVIFLTESAVAQQRRRELEAQQARNWKSKNVKIVVLDPGHGGEDPGTRNNGIIEKDYVLRMAKLVKSYFDQDPAFQAVLTRTGDYIIPLAGRSKMAERLGADAFVSIHVNYNRHKSIRGIEVYYESYRGAVGQIEAMVAELENQQDEIGGVGAVSPAPTKLDIANKQAETMYQSGLLANHVENRLAVAVPGLPSRGVKRAGFKVLHSLTLPSILVELGYTSNYYDAYYLKDPGVQQRLAQAIYLGVKDFLANDTARSGKDFQYLSYLQQVEAAKKARAEKAKQARMRLEKLRKNSAQYQVQKGDTIAKIAKKFNVSSNLLCEVNHLSRKSSLRAGQIILVPKN